MANVIELYRCVYIDIGGKLIRVAPCIDDGTTWRFANAHIDDGTTWHLCD